MRLLVDENMSPRVAELLAAAGHDAVHVRDLGLASASDQEIVDAAREQVRIIVSEDTDFAALIARASGDVPSLVLIRTSVAVTPDQHAALLIDNLPGVASELASGAIVVLMSTRTRVRRLPRSDESS